MDYVMDSLEGPEPTDDEKSERMAPVSAKRLSFLLDFDVDVLAGQLPTLWTTETMTMKLCFRTTNKYLHVFSSCTIHNLMLSVVPVVFAPYTEACSQISRHPRISRRA